MDAQQQLFGLMALAEEQQKAVQAAIDGLADERAALSEERIAVAQAAASVAGVAGDVRKATANVASALQSAAAEVLATSVRQALAGVAQTAAQALGEATKPVIGSLSSVVEAAGEVEGSMRRASAWFAWKWVAVAGGGAVGVCLLAYASLVWQLHQVDSLREEKAALQEEVVQLQANANDWAKQGGRIKLERCGEASRLCVRVNKSVSYGKDNDHFVLRGY
ncbi:hypothetical protein ACSFA3_22100 [Variovorax sp. RHLX14]|uniref:hypothetical protein n=1 Tax=Variovorax sp. RHLX14 TaxID=1259731 RepID=UPI003F45DB86